VIFAAAFCTAISWRYARISFIACLVSCRNDSISDSLSIVVLDKVSRLRLGERVEAVAGCSSECSFDVAESLTDLA
jgi:hypothetical protein